MAKGNPFLGMARGSAGDFTYYRMNGEQVFRARNRHPANPQTSLQLLQRVIMLTVQRAYSILSPLCDHAFQGRPEGTPNQSRFAAVNTAKLRNRDDIIDLIESYATGKYDVAPTMANFSSKFSMLPEMNDYIISEGSLPPRRAVWAGGRCVLPVQSDIALIVETTTTYQQLVEALGVQAGDQLTFIQLTCDDTNATGVYNGIQFARVILSPDDGDMTKSVFSESSESVFELNSTNANSANMGNLFFTEESNPGGLGFSFVDSSGAEPSSNVMSPAACAVILSRRSGDVWQRSSESLAVRSDSVGTGNLTYDHHVDYIGDAMDSFLTAKSSTLYLNQAEEP